MPYTLAHPAAILPLKRYCPRYLSFSALVIGSIAPDVAYVFGRLGLDVLSHSFVGSFLFCLPVGIVMLVAFFLLRGPVVERLPERHRKVFQPLCRQPIAPPLVLVVSLLIGSWTHLVWDSFTHSHGWLVARSPLLQTPICVIHGHTLAVCHLVWYASSFAGVGVICYLYERWRGSSRAVAARHAMLVGLLVLPIELIHHLYANVIGFALLGICSVALVIFVALNIGNGESRRHSD